jgi:X-Pro dipeptidyl-peptidase C-terminal non-catalytic domain
MAAGDDAHQDHREKFADPRNPVPSIGGGLGMDPVCVDQREAECRADVLVYSTPVLDQPVSVVGDVRAELYVSADVDDADVFVKLVDVYPDGTAYNLASSCLRLRYRDGFDKPADLVPGGIYRVEVTGITTASSSIAAVTVAAPGRSKRRPWRSGRAPRGMSCTAATSTTVATGAGSSSVHRQLTSVSSPDRTRPSENPPAPKAE